MGVNNNMALTIKKYSNGSLIVGEVGTDNAANPNLQRRRIAVFECYKARYDGISALAKGHINACTISQLNSEPYGIMSATTGGARKDGCGGGWYVISTNSPSVTGGYLGKVDCMKIYVNKDAYDQLSAAGKADVDPANWSAVDLAAFS